MVFRNLWRRPVRSWLAMAAVALAAFAGVTLPSLSLGVESAWIEVYNSRQTHLVARHRVGQGFLPNDYELESLAGMESLPGIARLAPVLSEWMEIPPMGTILVHGWAPDSYLREHLVHLQEVDLDPENSVFLGETAADLFSLRAGDTLEIGGEVLPIRAVFRSPAMNENFCAILPIELLGKLLGRENRANYLNIRLEPDVDRASQADLAREIEKNHPELRVFLASEMALDNPGVRIARAMSVAIGLLALAIASIGVASAALAASLERTKENALLLAMGWSPARIGGLVVAEAVLIAGMGSALGILLGISCMLLPSLVPALNLPIAPVIPPLLPLGLWCGNVFLAALCALPPAIGAVKKADASWLQK